VRGASHELHGGEVVVEVVERGGEVVEVLEVGVLFDEEGGLALVEVGAVALGAGEVVEPVVEGLEHLAAGLVAPGGVLGEGALDDQREAVGGDAHGELPGVWPEVVLDAGAVVDAGDGGLTHEHLPHDHADAVDVGGGGELLALELFGGGVAGCADEVAVARELEGLLVELAVLGLGEAEVEDLDDLAVVEVLRDHDVRGLHVPVEDLVAVCLVEAAQDLCGDAGGALGLDGALFADEVAQGEALDPLHDDVEDAVPLAVVEGGDGVGVAELAGELGLALEARGPGGVDAAVDERHDLEGDGAVHADVGAPVDDGAAPARDRLVDAVLARDRRTRLVDGLFGVHLGSPVLSLTRSRYVMSLEATASMWRFFMVPRGASLTTLYASIVTSRCSGEASYSYWTMASFLVDSKT
jgi:hypothetical protein